HACSWIFFGPTATRRNRAAVRLGQGAAGGSSERERDPEKGQECPFRQRCELFATPRLEGIEQRVATVQGIQDAEVGTDRPTMPTPVGLEQRVDLQVHAEERLVEPLDHGL